MDRNALLQYLAISFFKAPQQYNTCRWNREVDYAAVIIIFKLFLWIFWYFFSTA